MNKKVIALYGGSFNPPSNSHFSLAQEIIRKYNEIEKLIFMPVNSKYNKKGLIDNEHRYNMLKLLCAKSSKFEVSRIEIDKLRQLHTIETLEILEKIYPEHSMWFIIGTDNLKELNTWSMQEELLKKYKVLVLERNLDNMEEIIENDDVLKKYKDSFIKVNNLRNNLSSSVVREKIRKKENIKELVSIEIEQYIKENNLYTC